ncbi:MAG TPA: tetratricopeptide repeat protein [Candidatus Limnocylindria bacterium]|nr:tetratricopeptide repeat protein [Candidatus Limnocylindria bacterium]
MTTIGFRRPEPRRLAYRLIGAAAAVGIVLALTRLPIATPAVPVDVVPPVDGAAAAPQLDGGGSLGLLPPAQRVAFWEKRVADDGSFLDLINLADAYLDRSRATGDLDDLNRAATALDDAAKTAPYPDRVIVRRAMVAFALHDFVGAMTRADDVLRQTPDDLAALGVAGDARLETGDIAGARERYQRLAELAPSPASWSRLGRLAFLTGDPEAAARLVSRAAASSREEGAPDAEAFYDFQLGDLHRATGDLVAAEAAYTASLAALPEYVPAMNGLAAVLTATDRPDEAIRILERATARLPQPELVAALGDLYALTGDSARAEDQYRLVEGIEHLSAATGSVYDRQLVIFSADHERGLHDALSRARAELAVRDDIYGHDALAWVLYRLGRFDEAAVHAEAALALGTPDPRIAYHAGLIAAARGADAQALGLLRTAVRGVALLPPLQADSARAALAELQMEGARP